MNHFVPDFDTDDDYVHANPNSMNLPRKSIMGGEDDLMELLWHNGQVVIQNQTLNNNNNNNKNTSSPGKLHAAPPPSMHHQPLDQNVFIQEDEMTSRLHYPLRDDDFCSDLLFSSGVASASASQPHSVSRAASAVPITPFSAATPARQTMSQVTAARPPVPSSSVRPPAPSSTRPPVRNFMNFSRLRGDFTGGSSRVEPGLSISKAVVRESTLVNPSAIPSSSASESGLTGRAVGIDSQKTVNCGSNSAVTGGGAFPFAVPGHNRKGKAVAAPESEISGTSSKIEIEPINEQPETKKTIVNDRKRKEREDAIDETESQNEETKQGRGLTSTKRSRAAEVHNLSERKRRDRINERMKALQELIPRCNKSDKASMLDEAIEYMKSLQLQVQANQNMMSMGCGMMPMMYPGMQPYMAMGMGMNQHPSPSHPPLAFMPFPNMLAAQRPLPAQQGHLGGSVFPGPHYPVQPDPTLNQPQFPGYIDPYQHFRGLNPTQPLQFQSQETSYPSSSRVSSSKDSEEQGNHTTG